MGSVTSCTLFQILNKIRVYLKDLYIMDKCLKCVNVLQLRQQVCPRCRRNWRREMPWWGSYTASQEFWFLGTKVPRSTQVPKSSSTLSASKGGACLLITRGVDGGRGRGVCKILLWLTCRKGMGQENLKYPKAE